MVSCVVILVVVFVFVMVMVVVCGFVVAVIALACLSTLVTMMIVAVVVVVVVVMMEACPFPGPHAVWVFQQMWDRLESGMLKPEDITARALGGMVALFSMKRDLMHHVVSFELDRISMDPGAKAVLKDVMSSFSSYRTRLNPHPRPDPVGGHRPPDLSWLAGWTGSAKEMLRFTENLVFGDAHDLCLKNAIRGGKRSPADAMQTPSVKARMDEIMELRNAEKIKDSASLAAAVDGTAAANPTVAMTPSISLTEAETASTGHVDENMVFAKRTFHSYITLYVETESQHDLKLALNSSPLGSNFAIQNASNILIVFDVKQSAEPTAQPHIRIAPLKEQRLKTLVIGVMNARCEAAGKPFPNLIPGDLYMMPDGGRNIASKFRNLFVDEQTKAKFAANRQLNVCRSEDGLTSRRRLARHFVKQMETFHLFSAAKLRMPKKKKKFFSGTSLGDSLVEVPVLKEEELWATDKATKKAIYSTKNFIPVGGRAGSESEDEDDDDEGAEEQEPPAKKAKTETADTIPVFYHEVPKVLASEIINLYSIIGVIDLTAGAGTWAKASLDAGVHYFGVTLTMKHQEELSNHLVEYVKSAQLDPTSPLYVRGLSTKTSGLTLVPGAPAPAPTGGGNQPAEKNKDKKDKDKKDKKKDTKKKKKKQVSSSEPDSSSSASPAA